MAGHELVIGVLGGMGSYATVDLFRRIVDAFPARYEWERPRVLIDNRCTMPSRVRAILYGEQREELVAQLAESTRNLMMSGANCILYACNTSHVFLDAVKERVPEAAPYLIDMIDLLAIDMKQRGVQSAYLLASEGTIQTGIYQDRFGRHGLEIESAPEAEQPAIREFIEVVKQNKVDGAQAERFIRYIEGIGRENVILGCTELPVLYGYAVRGAACDHRVSIFDPMQSAIDFMVHNNGSER